MNCFVSRHRSLTVPQAQVKPLTISGSLSHRGSVRRVSRSQVTHVPISNCNCSMCEMTVSKLMSTCGNYSCASGGDGRCASSGGFLNGRARRLGPFSTAGARRLRAFVHYRSSHNRAKRDCGLYFLSLQGSDGDQFLVGKKK